MRTKRFAVEAEGKTQRKITSEMKDEHHHIRLQVWIEQESLKISQIHLAMFRHPVPECNRCADNLQKLVGTSLQHRSFRRTLLKTVGGQRGCFHVLELLHESQDYARSVLWDAPPDENGCYRISSLGHEGTVRCIAYRKG
jgi:hypothetical protein